MEKMHSFKHKAVGFLLFLFLTVFHILFFVTPVYATDYYYIQTSVDDKSWAISGGVVSGKTGIIRDTVPFEGKRLTSDMIGDIAGGNAISVLDSFDTEEDYKADNSNTENLPLTYPGTIKKVPPTPSATKTDYDRAQLVLNTLLYDMNTAFNSCFDKAKIKSISEYQEKLSDLIRAADSGGSVSGADFSGSFRQATLSDVNKFPSSEMTAGNYVVFEDSTGQEQIFCFEMRKSENGGIIIDWATLAAEAFINYGCGVTSSMAYSGEVSFLEEQVTSVFNTFVEFIAGSLGLWTLDELIFNAGMRGSNAYVFGVFPKTWQPTIWTFYFISMLIAIATLLLTIINNVVKKASSTMNPIARANAMTQILDVLKIVALLMLLPILLHVGLSLSAKLADIFGATLGDRTAADQFDVIVHDSKTIGGAIISLIYLGAIVYFNGYYFLRSVIVIFLIVVAPIAVSMIGFGEDQKRHYKKWQNAIITFIAIQPIHALILSILVILPTSGRTIENVMAVYALIPLGKLARQMILPDIDGDIAHDAGDYMKDKAKSAGMIGLVTAVGAAEGLAAGGIMAHTLAQKEKNAYDDKKVAENAPGLDSEGATADVGGFATDQKKEQAFGFARNRMNTENAAEAAFEESRRQQAERDAMRSFAMSGAGSVNDVVESSRRDTSQDIYPNQQYTQSGIPGQKPQTQQADASDNRNANNLGSTTNNERKAKENGLADNSDKSKSFTQADASIQSDSMAFEHEQPNEQDNHMETEIFTHTGNSNAFELGTARRDDSADVANDILQDKFRAEQKQQGLHNDTSTTANDKSEDGKNGIYDMKKLRKSVIRRTINSGKAGNKADETLAKARVRANIGAGLGAASILAGSTMMGVTGGKLGRGLMQAGTQTVSANAQRKASVENHMMDNYFKQQAELAEAANNAPSSDNSGNSSPNIKPRKQMTSFGESYQTGENTYDITMDKDDAAASGISNFVSKKDSFSYTTNENTSTEDMQNLSQMADIFQSGTEEEKQILRENGYEFVSEQTKNGEPTGQYRVTHNKNYAEPHNGRTIGRGSEKGSVEISNYTPDTPMVKSVADCKDYSNWKTEQNAKIETLKASRDAGTITNDEYKVKAAEVRKESYNWTPNQAPAQKSSPMPTLNETPVSQVKTAEEVKEHNRTYASQRLHNKQVRESSSSNPTTPPVAPDASNVTQKTKTAQTSTSIKTTPVVNQTASQSGSSRSFDTNNPKPQSMQTNHSPQPQSSTTASGQSGSQGKRSGNGQNNRESYGKGKNTGQGHTAQSGKGNTGYNSGHQTNHMNNDYQTDTPSPPPDIEAGPEFDHW